MTAMEQALVLLEGVVAVLRPEARLELRSRLRRLVDDIDDIALRERRRLVAATIEALHGADLIAEPPMLAALPDDVLVRLQDHAATLREKRRERGRQQGASGLLTEKLGEPCRPGERQVRLAEQRELARRIAGLLDEEAEIEGVIDGLLRSAATTPADRVSESDADDRTVPDGSEPAIAPPIPEPASRGARLVRLDGAVAGSWQAFWHDLLPEANLARILAATGSGPFVPAADAAAGDLRLLGHVDAGEDGRRPVLAFDGAGSVLAERLAVLPEIERRGPVIFLREEGPSWQLEAVRGLLPPETALVLGPAADESPSAGLWPDLRRNSLLWLPLPPPVLGRLRQKAGSRPVPVVLTGCGASGIDLAPIELRHETDIRPELLAHLTNIAELGDAIADADDHTLFILPSDAPWTYRWLEAAREALRRRAASRKSGAPRLLALADPPRRLQLIEDDPENEDPADRPVLLHLGRLPESDMARRLERALATDAQERAEVEAFAGRWAGLARVGHAAIDQGIPLADLDPVRLGELFHSGCPDLRRSLRARLEPRARPYDPEHPVERLLRELGIVADDGGADPVCRRLVLT
jgi:hypothetical protein